MVCLDDLGDVTVDDRTAERDAQRSDTHSESIGKAQPFPNR
jgi:hypothetical protein